MRPVCLAVVRMTVLHTAWVCVGVLVVSAVLAGSVLGSVVFYLGAALVLFVVAPARWFCRPDGPMTLGAPSDLVEVS